jgi:hypothetical protein
MGHLVADKRSSDKDGFNDSAVSPSFSVHSFVLLKVRVFTILELHELALFMLSKLVAVEGFPVSDTSKSEYLWSLA